MSCQPAEPDLHAQLLGYGFARDKVEMFHEGEFGIFEKSGAHGG